MEDDGPAPLPKGAGQIPTWWLEETPHDVRETTAKKRKEKSKTNNEGSEVSPKDVTPEGVATVDDAGGAEGIPDAGGQEKNTTETPAEPTRESQQKDEEVSPEVEDVSATVDPEKLSDPEFVDQDNGGAMLRQQEDQEGTAEEEEEAAAATEGAIENGQEEAPSTPRINVRMTSEEEAAAVEAKLFVPQAVEFGQQILKPRDRSTATANDSGGSAGTHSPVTQGGADTYGNSANDKFEESIMLGEATGPKVLGGLATSTGFSYSYAYGAGTSPSTSMASPTGVGSAAGNKSFSVTPKKQYKTAFTGVSPFDFAMQQRAREKERREKEREARLALARHHGNTVEADKAVGLRKLEQELKRKKKEAEEFQHGFKGAGVDRTSELAAELKNLEKELKSKRKEAEANNQGYRDRKT